MFFPDDLSARAIEAEKVAGLADGVNAIAIDGGRGAGAALEHVRVERLFVAMLPERLAGGGVETDHDVVAVVLVSRGEGAAAGDGDGRRTGADFGFPKLVRRRERERQRGGDDAI